MISNDIEKMTCPKCGAIGSIIRFDRDIYIVRDNKEHSSERTLYGCTACTTVFTYDNNMQKNLDNIDLRTIFYNIPSGKREDIGKRIEKKRRVVNHHR